MKLAWTIGAAIIAAGVGIASSSYAQTNTPESSNPSASQPNSSNGAAESDSSSDGRMMGGGMMGRGMMDGRMVSRWGGGDQDREMGGMRMRGRMGHEQFDQGAHFRFRRGDAMIDIRCPKDEEMASCVQAATRLMRAVKDMQNTGASSPPSSSPGAQGQ
jgi:hypothetical protein